MRYYVGGSGRSLILLHGLSGAADNFVELAVHLGGGLRLLVPELPGHGGSAPLPAAPSLDAYADRVVLLAQLEGMLPATVVGHSLGGLVALRLALRHPAAAQAVVLLSSAGIASTTRRSAFWLNLMVLTRPGRKISPLRGVLARSPRMRSVVFNRYEVADARSLSPRMVEGFLSAARQHTDIGSAVRVLLRDDPRLDLGALRCPCLVVWGTNDRQVPVDDAFELARRLGGELRLVADCGHLLIGERPDAVADAIRSFLDGIREVDEVPGEAEVAR